MDIINLLDEEIEATKKSTQAVKVNLVKVDDRRYKATLPFKIEGDYVLTSDNYKDIPVQVEWENNQISLELKTQGEDHIVAFLKKDASSMLSAIKKSIKITNFAVNPAFIVGPPGTGKTKVITKALMQMIKQGKRVLVIAPTNMAVENIFEKLTPEDFGVDIDDIVMSVKTKVPSLVEMSPKNTEARRLLPIQDEMGILKEAKEELLRTRRDAQPNLEKLSSRAYSHQTNVANINADITVATKQKKGLESQENAIQRRITALNGNVLLKNVAKLFTSKKEDELKEEIAVVRKKIDALEIEIVSFQSKKKNAEIKLTNATQEHVKAKEIVKESKKAIEKIQEHLQKLAEDENILKNHDIYKSAKIVGATMIGACLNKKIIEGDFDVVITDEASMALIPVLIAGTQAVKIKKFSTFKYKADKELTSAQNKAVKLAISSQIVLVGDPRQLSPIAKTYPMKQSVFTLYGVHEIFNGNAVENTVFLDVNFRNHYSITKLASEMFYGGMLKSGKDNDDKTSALFIRRSASKMVSTEGSFVNYGNMKVVITQIEKALQRGRRCIGVITPYRKQAELIEQNFQHLIEQYPDAEIQAGTVHKYQGKEKDIVIFDITFSPSQEDGSRVPATYTGDIRSETAKLLNVAMTRAKSLFILVGDIDGILASYNNSLVMREWVEKINNLNLKEK